MDNKDLKQSYTKALNYIKEKYNFKQGVIKVSKITNKKDKKIIDLIQQFKNNPSKQKELFEIIQSV